MVECATCQPGFFGGVSGMTTCAQRQAQNRVLSDLQTGFYETRGGHREVLLLYFGTTVFYKN